MPLPTRRRHPESDYGNLGSTYQILGGAGAVTQETATVTIYKEGTNYIARKGTTGDIISSNSNFSTVCNAAGAWITGNGIIFVKDPGTDIVVPSTITFTNKEIYVTSDMAKLDFSALNNIVFHFIDNTGHGVLSGGISNFRIKGDKTKTSQIFVKFSEVIAKVNNIINTSTDAIYRFLHLYGSCPGSRITNNTVVAYNGIKIEGYVSGSTFESNGSIIDGNYIDSVYDGSNINTSIEIIYSWGIMICNNYLAGSCYGVISTNSYYLKIANNYIDGGVIGADLNCNFPHVSNNYFQCQYGDCIGVKLYSTFGGTVTGNVIYSPNNHDWHGIQLENLAKRVSITGNLIIEESTPADTYGIYGAGTNNEITIVGNTFTGTASMTATAIKFNTLVDSTIMGNSIRNFSTKINITTRTSCVVEQTNQCYTLRVHGGYTATIADSLTYYYGSLIGFAMVTTAGNSRVYVPKAGIIRKAYLFFYCGTESSAENIAFYIRVNDTTDYVITTEGHLNANQILNSNAALNIPVAEGDFFEIKVTMPVFATNPAGVSPTGDILIECE